MKNDFLLAIGQLAAEKNLSQNIIFEAVEAALASAYRREGEEGPEVIVKIDPGTGETRAFIQKTVVSTVDDAQVEMTLEEAKRYKPTAINGDVLEFDMKIPENAGRIAAQTAKQVVLQRLREAERDAVFDEYHGHENELVLGTVQRAEPRQTIVEIGRGTETVLPWGEQIRNEHLRAGERLKVIILEVNEAAKGPQVVVSRAHRNLLRRLFENEVPEVSAGRVEIKAIAREGGHRSKVAVHARMQSIDPIGACVGMRGSRIQNVVNELNGERIDIIKWDADIKAFIANALSPAEVVSVDIDEDEHRATVTVPDSMLSLAIGKEGQNARLAAKLTSWWIDIRSQSALERAEDEMAEAPASFEPYREGEEPDIDIIEVTPEPEPVVATPAAATVVAAAVTEEEPVVEEDPDFAAAMASMEVPDEEERESETYGEERLDEDDEEYEIPTMVVPEERPSAIRFAEDVLPTREEDEADAKKKKKRAPRVEDELDEDLEEIDYSGRIH
jgi:transcription termination/antitermination protein NusA